MPHLSARSRVPENSSRTAARSSKGRRARLHPAVSSPVREGGLPAPLPPPASGSAGGWCPSPTTSSVRRRWAASARWQALRDLRLTPRERILPRPFPALKLVELAHELIG